MVPVLGFQIFGLSMLSLITFTFLLYDTDLPAFVWPALIAGFVGIPFGFATNIKKLIDTVTVSTN